ncbi:MAG: gfo/Idh/MocA family oxidoreductase, partial [Candidatus Neomarinimicrobiota bacterium]
GEVPIAEDKSSAKIEYDFQYPLTEQLKYFIDCIGGEDVNIANGQSGLDVINILEKASSCL